MDQTRSVGEDHEARTSPQRLFPPSNIGDCSHGETGLLPAVTYRAKPVLRTAATTEVAGDQSDEGDGVEPSSPNAGGISFRNIIIIALCKSDG